MHHLRAIAHVTISSHDPAATVSDPFLLFRHLRLYADAHPDTMRPSIAAALHFIFPHNYSDHTTTTTTTHSPCSKRPRSTNIPSTDLNTNTIRRLRDRLRFSSPLPISSRPRHPQYQYHHQYPPPSQSQSSSYLPLPHVFAITRPDGSRQYCFCKHISPVDALLVVAAVPYSALYVRVLERSSHSWLTLSNITLPSTSPATSEDSTTTTSSAGTCYSSSSSSSSSPSRKYRQENTTCPNNNNNSNNNPLLTFGHLSDPITSTWLTSHIHSLIVGDLSLHTARIDPYWQDDDEHSSSSYNTASSISAPGSISALHHPLADVAFLLRHVTPRSLGYVLAALMDERRVAVVGHTLCVASRLVLAIYNLLRPFEWPHLLSPVLPDVHAAVFGTPFPYLVGTTIASAQRNRHLMDGTLLLYVDRGANEYNNNNDIEIVGDEAAERQFEALFTSMPRLAKLRLERRIAKLRTRALYSTADINYNYGDNETGKSLIDGIGVPAQQAVECFFRNVLSERAGGGTRRAGEEGKARRHRSFGTRKSSDSRRHHVRRNLSWAHNLSNDGGNNVDGCGSLCARFHKTQMYLEWKRQNGDGEAEDKIQKNPNKSASTRDDLPLLEQEKNNNGQPPPPSASTKEEYDYYYPDAGMERKISKRPHSWNARAARAYYYYNSRPKVSD